MSTVAEANINIQVTREVGSLIDQAASAIGVTRSELILEAVTERAYEVLENRTRVLPR